MPYLELIGSAGQRVAIEAQPGARLSEAIWLSGQAAPESLCSGLGLCGRCRVRFISQAPAACEADGQRFSPAELEQGWRLACRHNVPDCASLCLEAPYLQPAKRKLCNQTGLQPAWLAIDLGTTSIQWQAGCNQNPDLAHGSLPNPQGGAGADIMSRLAFAMRPGGQVILQRLARQAIADIVQELASSGYFAERACVAANSALTEILLGCDTSGLAAAPYQLACHGGRILELTLPDQAQALPTVLPPLPGPFIGGDISAGLLTLAHAPRPFVLADLGTNAELALLTAENRLYFASAPLGPALEGVGPACGQPAESGVITGFQLGPGGLVALIPEPRDTVKGISATGYISLLTILVNLGILAADGGWSSQNTPLAAKISQNLTSGRLQLPHGQYLTRADIELLLQVKAAFRLALDNLLKASGMTAQAVQVLFLAGALGGHVNGDDLATLGFLPLSLANKISACGNSALAGACLLAQEPGRNADLAALCAGATIVQPEETADYIQAYLAAMRWGNHAA